jgi:cell division septal protein FtsQ
MSQTIYTPPRTRHLLSPRRWRFWVIVADLLILGGIWSVQHWPLLKLKLVAVEGPEAWQDVVHDLVTVAADSNLLSIDRDALERRLELEFGARAQCRTRLELPDKLTIQLTPAPLVLWTEGRAGVSVDGNVVVQPVCATDAPVWRTPLRTEVREHGNRAFEAAAAWSDVLAADRRWKSVVSELTTDPKQGWIMTASDGQTRIVLGWDKLETRAKNVALLLAQPDSLLAQPCTIDARFDDRLVVRPCANRNSIM